MTEKQKEETRLEDILRRSREKSAWLKPSDMSGRGRLFF